MSAASKQTKRSNIQRPFIHFNIKRESGDRMEDAGKSFDGDTVIPPQTSRSAVARRWPSSDGTVGKSTLVRLMTS